MPGLAGDQPSAPDTNDVGCQTVVGMYPSVATQTSTAHVPQWIAAGETQTPAPPVCRDGWTCSQCDLACWVRFSTSRGGDGKVKFSVCREDLLSAILTAGRSNSWAGRSAVSWQHMQPNSASQPWPAKGFGHQSSSLDAFDIQLALSC